MNILTMLVATLTTFQIRVSEPQTITVCDAVTGKYQGTTVTVRGFGRFNRSGEFLLLDHTCGGFDSERLSGLLVEPVTLSKTAIFSRFQEAKFEPSKSLFQALVVGQVSCKLEDSPNKPRCALTPSLWSRFEELK